MLWIRSLRAEFLVARNPDVSLWLPEMQIDWPVFSMTCRKEHQMKKLHLVERQRGEKGGDRQKQHEGGRGGKSNKPIGKPDSKPPKQIWPTIKKK